MLNHYDFTKSFLDNQEYLSHYLKNPTNQQVYVIEEGRAVLSKIYDEAKIYYCWKYEVADSRGSIEGFEITGFPQKPKAKHVRYLWPPFLESHERVIRRKVTQEIEMIILKLQLLGEV